MGKLNLITGSWTAKVGQLVGAKWKDKHTLRAYAIPSNPDTDAQQTVRTVFKEMSAWITLFADQIKYLTALDTSSMTIRNALMAINKDQFTDGSFDEETFLVSKGGLPYPTNFASTSSPTSAGTKTFTWTAPTASNITSACLMVVITIIIPSSSAELADYVVDVTTALASAAKLTTGTTFSTANSGLAYYYFLDEHGSYKVASTSKCYDKTTWIETGESLGE